MLSVEYQDIYLANIEILSSRTCAFWRFYSHLLCCCVMLLPQWSVVELSNSKVIIMIYHLTGRHNFFLYCLAVSRADKLQTFLLEATMVTTIYLLLKNHEHFHYHCPLITWAQPLITWAKPPSLICYTAEKLALLCNWWQYQL